MRRRRLARLAVVCLAAAFCVLLIVVLGVRQVLLASLPQVEGTRTLAGLSAQVRVERDRLGIPTIRGDNRLDVARATGFVHAQERFFEMDMARRFAAGEMSELVGAATLANDRTNRPHRLRATARAVVARAQPGERALLQAYADGVNAGLAALGARPPEYLLLRAQPAAWLPEDCVLVVGAMFSNDLANSRRERELQAMYAALPGPLVDFLRPLGDEWDAPLVGGVMAPAPMPGPQVVDFRRGWSGSAGGFPQISADFPFSSAGVGGSNAWAIAGTHTVDGHAIVANDPHLPLQVPNIWYRLSLEWPDEKAVRHRVTGASLPGLPFVSIGSNGHVAWGFTVAFDDRSDMVIVDVEDSDGDRYRTPDGAKRFEHTIEPIKVRGADDERLNITSTIWGPIVGRDSDGHPLAQQWQAHHADGINLAFREMEYATSVEQALDIANRSRLPSYNMIVADDRGAIGWTVTGGLPKRIGFDGRVPTSWADGTRRWDGWLDPADYPRVVNPPSGRLWNANNRPVGPPLLERLGLEGYIMGPRARQIRDDLMSLDRSTPRESLRIQLDDRALFLERWRAFLVDRLRGQAASETAQRREFRRLVDKTWDGRSSIPSVAYRLVERFRYELAERVIGPMLPATVSTHALRPGAIIEWWESALWQMVHERPPHLLPAKWHDWNQVTLAAIDATIDEATANGRRPLAEATWGKTTDRMSHPLSRAVPLLGRWLDMPYAERAGDTNLPRVRMPSAAGDVSATFRMVVSPGHEETAIFHMPGGESGHFLSPHYRDMQQSWADGVATPLLPGPTVQILQLHPQPQPR